MNEIRVKVGNGYLVAGKSKSPENNGIYVCFETDNGDIADIVYARCPESDKNKIEVYCFEDVNNEDYTKKFVLDTKEICKAVEG